MRILEHISYLLDYPQENYLVLSDAANTIIQKDYLYVKDSFERFDTGIKDKSVHEMQELFIQTFDVNAKCHMDVGYLLFGDDGKRNQLLINLNKEHKKVNNNIGSELADHLPNMLRLLYKLEDRQLDEELSVSIMLPALRIMLEKFENDTNPYAHLFQLLIVLIENSYENTSYKEFVVDEKAPCGLSHYSCGSDFIHDSRRNKRPNLINS